MLVGDRFLASIVAAAAVGLGAGVLLVYGFDAVEPSSKAYSQPAGAPSPPVEKPKPEAPNLGTHAVEKVISSSVVSIEGLGPVRLLGVDASSGPGGKPVDPVVAESVLRQLTAGQQVEVVCDPSTADSNFKDDTGAYLVYLLRSDGTIVNVELVAKGMAVADLDRAYERRDGFVRAEREARFEGRGIWESAASKPLAPLAPSDLPPGAKRGNLEPIAPQPSPGKNDVLVTSDGRFHKPSCKQAKGGIVMSSEDARGKRYLACPYCFVSPRVKV
ncbi:MAG: thermonuclease family protein [Blastocatellia bacterium]|nr:thermonuclease family protein [Blastocatellia bacterium]